VLSVVASSNVAPRRIRSSILIWYASTVSVKFSNGVTASPALRLTDFSSLSGLAPRALAAGWSTGKMPISSGAPAMKLVTTLLKWICPRPGARNPVLPAARTVRRGGALPAAGELAGHERAEVTVVLEPHRRVGQDLARDVG